MFGPNLFRVTHTHTRPFNQSYHIRNRRLNRSWLFGNGTLGSYLRGVSRGRPHLHPKFNSNCRNRNQLLIRSRTHNIGPVYYKTRTQTPSTIFASGPKGSFSLRNGRSKNNAPHSRNSTCGSCCSSSNASCLKNRWTRHSSASWQRFGGSRPTRNYRCTGARSSMKSDVTRNGRTPRSHGPTPRLLPHRRNGPHRRPRSNLHLLKGDRSIKSGFRFLRHYCDDRTGRNCHLTPFSKWNRFIGSFMSGSSFRWSGTGNHYPQRSRCHPINRGKHSISGGHSSGNFKNSSHRWC